MMSSIGNTSNTNRRKSNSSIINSISSSNYSSNNAAANVKGVVKRTGYAAENPLLRSEENSGPKKKRKRNRQDKMKGNNKRSKLSSDDVNSEKSSTNGQFLQKRINDRKYSDELVEYLREWNNKKRGVANSWKFNKRLQYWAIDSCFDSQSIDGSLFSELLPYYGTIQESARSLSIYIYVTRLIFSHFS